MGETILQTVIELYSRTSNSKEEAFLKGYLMGLGIMDYEPNWALLRNYPENAFRIEREITEIHKQMRLELIKEARSMLAEVYQNEGRKIPEWVEEE